MNASLILWTLSLLSTKYTNAFVPHSQVGTLKRIHDQEKTKIHAVGSNDINIDSNHPFNRRDVIVSSMKQISTLLFFAFQSASAQDFIETKPSIVFGSDDIMNPKAHGTSDQPVQDELRFGVSRKLADRICCYNRHFAELGGYYQKTNFENVVLNSNDPITFYDSVTGKPLFIAPIGRSSIDFLKESEKHGWPSFRDQEVVWENVSILKSSGETVSNTGTHLGHNIPDKQGNRYCINLVSIAGNPITS